MGNKEETFESLSKELMQNHLELTALIQVSKFYDYLTSIINYFQTYFSFVYS